MDLCRMLLWECLFPCTEFGFHFFHGILVYLFLYCLSTDYRKFSPEVFFHITIKICTYIPFCLIYFYFSVWFMSPAGFSSKNKIHIYYHHVGVLCGLIYKYIRIYRYVICPVTQLLMTSLVKILPLVVSKLNQCLWRKLSDFPFNLSRLFDILVVVSVCFDLYGFMHCYDTLFLLRTFNCADKHVQQIHSLSL